MKFRDVIRTEWFRIIQQEYWKSNKTTCPICGRKLVKKYEGLVYNGNNCLLGDFKLGEGWVYLDGKKSSSNFFHNCKYYNNPESHYNIKKWISPKKKRTPPKRWRI